MALVDFAPEIWARLLNISLRKSLVGMSITNQDYEGEIRNAGDTVHITRPSAVNVGSYSERTNITVQEPSETQLSLSIDQKDYYAIDIELTEEVQSNVNLSAPYLEEAVYSLADATDQFILGQYTGAAAANVVPKFALSASTIYAMVTEAKRRLSLSNCPKMGRWIVLSPYEVEVLENSSQFQKASDLGDEISEDGFGLARVGRIAGFDVFESNNLTEANDGSNVVRHCPFGHRVAITFATQIMAPMQQMRELRFSTLFKGLHLYGAQVVKPAALGDLRVIVS